MRRKKNVLDKKFQLGLALNTGFMIFELLAGISVNSLALISDAIHNMTDSMTLLISWLGNRMAKKPADAGHTFGHGRAAILSALINSMILIGAAIFIFFEAYQRLMHPEPVKSGLIIAVVAGLGIIANGAIAWTFSGDQQDLNAKSAYINMLFDTIFSIAAVIAGILINITGKTWIDPLVSILIGFGLVYATVMIVSDAVNILLEGVPRNLDLKVLKQEIMSLDEVRDIKKLRVWAISTDEYALACHFVPEHYAFKDVSETTMRIREKLKGHGIGEVTIEIDWKK